MGPNTVTVLFGRINNNFTLEECDLHEVNSIENNCVMEDPWLYLKDTVCIVRKDNSPADFYEMINISIVLQRQEEFAIAYLDDIFKFSKTPEDHPRYIQNLFNRQRKMNQN